MLNSLICLKKYTDLLLECLQGKADCPYAMYSDRTLFDRRPKPTATLFIGPQQMHVNYFQLCEMSQNSTFEGVGVIFGNLHK